MSGMPIPEGRYLMLGSGLRLHYHEIGRAGDGRGTVLCLHGGGPGASGYSNYRRNMQAMADAGYHVLAPDLIGFGLSDKPDTIDYTSDLHVDAMEQLVAATGASHVVPVGNSLGGSVAIEYALRHRDDVPGLILMAPGSVVDPATFWGKTEGGTALAALACERPLAESRFREVLGLLVFDPAGIDEAVVAERFPIAAEQPTRVFTTVSIRPSWKRLHELTMPVLAFWGARDRFLPVEQVLVLLEKVPRAKAVVSNECGHWFMIERPDDFNREVQAFLTGLSGA